MTACTDQELADHWCANDKGTWRSPCCQLTSVGGLRLLGMSGTQAPDVAGVCDGFVEAAQRHVVQQPRPERTETTPLSSDALQLRMQTEALLEQVCDLTATCPAGFEEERQQWANLKATECTLCEEGATKASITRKIRNKLKQAQI